MYRPGHAFVHAPLTIVHLCKYTLVKIPWRDLPARCGHWNSVYRRWRQAGVRARMPTAVAEARANPSRVPRASSHKCSHVRGSGAATGVTMAPGCAPWRTGPAAHHCRAGGKRTIPGLRHGKVPIAHDRERNIAAPSLPPTASPPISWETVCAAARETSQYTFQPTLLAAVRTLSVSPRGRRRPTGASRPGDQSPKSACRLRARWPPGNVGNGKGREGPADVVRSWCWPP